MPGASINSISIEQIERLSDVELSGLLHRLLAIETGKNQLVSYLLVPLKINQKDGGEDGRIEWSEQLPRTKWLPGRFCIFQVKATDLTPAEAYFELLEGPRKLKPRRLKSQINEVAAVSGHYVLFTNKALNSAMISARIKKFQLAVQDAGYPTDQLKIGVYDANRIKDWVNENISAVTFVQECAGVTRLSGLRTWNEWQRDMPGIDIPYMTNPTILTRMRQIRSSLSEAKAIRVIGHSGLGKTRFVMESFRSGGSSSPERSLQEQLVYYDAGGGGRELLENYIISHRNNQSGIIVVDNCPEDLHKKLAQLVRAQGNFLLITIDYATTTDENYHIKLDRNEQKDIVRQIIEHSFQNTLLPADKDVLSTQSEGYPQMAVLLSRSVTLGGNERLDTLLDGEFIRKLLFPRSEQNAFEYEIIKACSVLSSFGFVDDSIAEYFSEEEKKYLNTETAFVREKICMDFQGRPVTVVAFYRTCLKYKDIGVLEQRGTRLMVRPAPLAIKLAAEWWRTTPADMIKSILIETKESDLGRYLAERLTDLDQVDQAKKIVKDVWGPDGLFATAEVLNTKMGSLLFRYVVEVNPSATAKAIEKAFSHLNRSEALQIVAGRRNLVGSLEKLSFHAETFPIAAKLLYLFGVAENESWGNNARNQFINLFQLYLPGTMARYPARIEIIDWGLQKKDPEYTRLAISALERALKNDHFQRMGGAEQQGSGAPLKDYEPEDWNVIFEYWEMAVQRLFDVLRSDADMEAAASEALLLAVRTLSLSGNLHMVKKVAENLITISSDYRSKITLQIKRIRTLPDVAGTPVSEGLRTLLQNLIPEDLMTRLYIAVTQGVPEEYRQDDNGNYIDMPRIAVEQLAEQLVRDGVDWLPFLSGLVTGDQQQSYNFGKALATATTDIGNLVNANLRELRKIPPEKQNPGLLAGLLAGSNNSTLNQDVLTTVIHDPALRHNAWYLVRAGETRLEYIFQLFELVDKHGFPVENFMHFKYGSVLADLDPVQLHNLGNRLLSYGKAGRWTAFSIVYMNSFSNVEKWSAHETYMRKLLEGDNLMIGIRQFKSAEGYYWGDAVQRILRHGQDFGFAKTIAQQILEVCEHPDYSFSADNYILMASETLLQQYFDTVWPWFGKAILQSPLSFLHIRHLIGTRNGHPHHREGLAFQYPEHHDTIMAWVAANEPIAPRRIANMMPLQGKDGHWHPLALRLINKYGQDPVFIGELTANFGTYGITGSRLPYLKKKHSLFKELENHPIQTVKEWAKSQASQVETEIQRDRLQEEERDL